MNTIIYRESGYRTDFTWETANQALRAAGLDAPADLGHTETETRWYGPEYAQATEDPEWPDNTPYWFVSVLTLLSRGKIVL